jgi:hypothetical protein
MKASMLTTVRNVLLALLFTAVITPIAQAQTAPRQLNCLSLPGAGSFSNPRYIGRVDRTTVVSGCPRLSSGQGFSSRYYSFDLTRPAPNGSVVGTGFVLTPDAQSAVHPRLALPNGQTLITSSSPQAFWYSLPPALFRFLPITNLPADRYILGVEKLDSPLRSLQTPNFDLYILFP